MNAWGVHASGAPAIGAVMNNIVELFWDHVDHSPDRPALRQRVGSDWEPLSWRAYGEAVTEVAAGLVALGIEPGDRVAILAFNQIRWHEADVGILAAGATSVPAYPTSASGQLTHLLGHSGARLCFVADRDQLTKVLLGRHVLPALEHIVMFDDPPDGLDDELLLTFDELRTLGRRLVADEPGLVRARSAAITPDSTATIVYTSGTTGPPKGVMLTYANLSATIRSIIDVVEIGPEDRFLSFLPLSHIAERTVSHFGQIAAGGETWFAASLATVPIDLRACRPTIFFAVPRVWEKFKTAILDEVAKSPRPTRMLAEAYFRTCRRRSDGLRAEIRPGFLDRARFAVVDRAQYALLDRLVGTRIRRQIGLDQARILVSGAAPVHPDLLWWFSMLGLPIAEVYGQTEDGGPTTLNPPNAIRIGSVGRPMPGLEVRIAEDGEILARGESVSPGYYDNPEETTALIDPEGWMHSGDLGRIDAGNYLFVTGRKKDLIITSSGKNIAPQALETRLLAEPLIAQAVVIGDGRAYLTVLLALDSEAVGRWADKHHKLADFGSLLDDPALHAEIATAVDQVNHGRAPIEQIKAWRLLPRELTVASGELTPTFKVKRSVATALFADLVEEMYETPRPASTDRSPVSATH